MPLDEKFYARYIDIFENKIESILADDMIGISKECNFGYRGYFQLTYQYVPHNYKIIIENEFRAFSITIYDSENASNVLNRIKNHDTSLDECAISDAILLLREILIKNDFNLYFSVGNKTYRKNKNGVKRIKDIKEILNG